MILQERTITCRVQKLGAIIDGVGLGDADGATLGQVEGQGLEKTRFCIP